MAQYGREDWTDYREDFLSLAQLKAYWPKIRLHPRLVFEHFALEEECMVRYYLATGKPFTVVLL